MFCQCGSNKVETESESTTLLSEIAIKIVKPSFYEHLSTPLLINLTCRLNKKWILLSAVWKLQNDVKHKEPLREITCTGVFRPIRPYRKKTNFSN